MVYAWLAALLLFVITEVSTLNLVSIWFAAGSLVALISSLLGAELWLQFVLFFVVSGIILAFLRPLAKKYLNPRKTLTNADRVVGHMCTVTEDIDNISGKGAVYIDGKTWTARSSDGSVILSGSLVCAVSIEGVKLIVKPAEKCAADIK